MNPLTSRGMILQVPPPHVPLVRIKGFANKALLRETNGVHKPWS